MNVLPMAPAARPVSDHRLRLAEGLLRVAMGALALMPFGMAVAHRSSPVFMVLSALCCLGAVLAEGQGRQLCQAAAASLRSPIGLAVLAFLGWSLISIGWSEFRAVSMYALGEFWLPVASAFVVALVLPWRMTPGAFWLLAGAVVAASLLIVVELRTDLVARRMLGMRWDSYIFNRPTITLLLVMLPLLGWFAGHRRYGWAVAVAVALAFGAAMAHSDSGAADLGLAVMGAAFVVAWSAPRLAPWLGAAAVVIAIATAPFLGTIADRLIPGSMHERMADNHTRERVDLWLSFGSAVKAQPILGGGFGISPRMRDTEVAKQVPADRWTLLAAGHPHNTPLQIWAELGIVGAFLALVIVLLVLRGLARQSRLVMSLSLSLLAGAATIALVGHGAWQGWWAASVGAAVVWLLAFKKTRLETMP